MRMRNAAGTVVNVEDDLAARLRRAGWTADQSTPRTDVAEELPVDKDTLIAEAEAAGINIDRRWGVQRLRDAINNARASHG